MMHTFVGHDVEGKQKLVRKNLLTAPDKTIACTKPKTTGLDEEGH